MHRATLAGNIDALRQRFGATIEATGADLTDEPLPVEAPVQDDVEDWVRATVMAAQPAAVILIGAGNGAVLDALERHGRPAVVVVEPSVKLAHGLLAMRDRRTAIAEGRLAVLAGPDFRGVSAIAQSIALTAETPIHVIPGLSATASDALDRARHVATQLRFESAANEQARRSMAGRYLVHTLANAAQIARGGDAARLAGVAAGMPAVITAAGPSLDANLRDLHRIRDQAVLIACDTTARPLTSVGLEPHFVVALDPSLANACHLGGLHVPRRTWLVAEGSLHPSAFAHFTDRTFFFRVADHHPWPWLRSAGIDCQRFDVWGSVVTAAFDLALRMGCSPIIFAGADLSFPGGRPYCRGTTLEAQWASWNAGGDSYEHAFAMLVDKWPEAYEDDVHGQRVRTSPHMIAFRDWLVTRAQQATGTRVVNATNAGILHGASIEIAHASDVLARRAQLDFAGFDDRLREAYQCTDRRAALFDHIAALGVVAQPAALRVWREHAGATLADRDLIAPLMGPEFSAWALARQPVSR